MSIQSPTVEKNYNSFSEFENLNKPHKALTVIVSIFLFIFTLGIAIPFALPPLIGRLRKLEIDEETKQANTAQKTDEVASEIKKPTNVNGKDTKKSPSDDEWDFDDDDMIDELFDEKSKTNGDKAKADLIEKVKEDFLKDREAINKIIDELKASRKADRKANGSSQKISEERVLEKYKAYKKEKDKKFNLSNQQRYILEPEIKNILDDLNYPDSFQMGPDGIFYKLSEEKNIGDTEADKGLFPLRTYGDGSCAFHALLGEPKDGYYFADEKFRKEFCDYLQDCFKNGKLPEKIECVLDDYFNFPKEAPKEFNEAIKVPVPNSKKIIDLRNAYGKNYKKLTHEKQEQQKKKFREHPSVFGAYLDHLRKNGTYLLQDELEAVAYFFNKRIRLFQPEWGVEIDSIGETTFNPEAKDEVCIYFKNDKHYERAEIRPLVKEENKKEEERTEALACDSE